MKPYYVDSDVILYHCDVRDFTGSGKPGWAAAVVSSPPYNVGIAYETGSDTLPWAEYWQMAQHVAEVASEALCAGGRLWWNTAVSVPETPVEPGSTAPAVKRRVLLGHEWANRFQAAGIELVDTIAWTSMRGAGSAWGSWESPSSPNLRGDYEQIMVGCKGRWERTAPEGQQPWRDKVGGWQHLVTTVWDIPPATRDGHPVPFPVSMAERCIRLSAWPGEVIFDPFAGSGTTLLAAKRLGRKAVGVELSEKYCEMTAQRLAQGTLGF